MNLQRRSIDELKPAPYNPRVPLKSGMPGYERLKRSLTEFDLVQPIVWNERTGHVVGGHQRLQILKDTGVKEVEVSVVSLNDDREKALNVALNNHFVGGNWEYDKLADLMSELIELPDFDETLTGFDDRELRDLMFQPQDELEPETDAAPDNQIEITVSILEESWPAFQPEFDTIVARYSLQPHIRFPEPAQ